MLYFKFVPIEKKEEAEREIRALKIIDHPAVPRLCEVKEYPEGVAYGMTYFPGNTLGELIRSGRSFPADKVAEMGVELCDTLGRIHALSPEKVFHLDLHPDNIILSCGHLRIVDFGNSWCGQNVPVRLKRSGTPQFSAPELFTGDPVDERADIYSLGMILLYLLKNVGNEKKDAATVEGIRHAAFDCIRLKPEFRIRQADELARVLRRVR
ncbi:MAG: protein kinase [Lachnospiraceae bacterium]|nr:protein kinase [Lachnospiraceae bacterium]